MAEPFTLAVALFNNTPTPNLTIDEQGVVLVINSSNPRETNHFIHRPAIRRAAHPIDLYFIGATSSECVLFIDTNRALQGGQVLIECSRYLQRKLMSVKLPDDPLLTHGLRITLLPARVTQPTFVEYTAPGNRSLAHLRICANDATPEGDVPQLISIHIDGQSNPIITMLNNPSVTPEYPYLMPRYQVLAMSPGEPRESDGLESSPLVMSFAINEPTEPNTVVATPGELIDQLTSNTNEDPNSSAAR